MEMIIAGVSAGIAAGLSLGLAFASFAGIIYAIVCLVDKFTD